MVRVRSRRRAWAVRVVGVSATLLAVVLVGCTPVSEPSPSRAPYVMPQIVGETVSDSPLEDDEWVIATRAYALGWTLAYDDWRRWRYADYAELLYAGYADKLTLPVPAPHGDQIAWADQIMAAVNAQAGVDTNAILPNYDIAYLAAFGAADGTSGG